MTPFFTRCLLASRYLAAALLAGGLAAPAAAQTAYGLSADLAGNYSLVTFQVTAPSTFTATVRLTGSASGQDLAGLDSRPATGQLYALGYNYRTSQAQVYTLAPATGVLTAVGGPLQLALGTNTGRIGFDFDPTYDVLRVTAENRNNFRLSPDTGALVATDATLAYAAADPNAGQRPAIGSVAFTNSYRGSNLTTLYAIDNSTSRLAAFDIPAVGPLRTVGPLGVAVDALTQTSDLDIYYNATTGQNTGYLSLYSFSSSTFQITSRLYTVNLTTGATTAVGQLGTSTSAGVTNIALALPALPPITGQLAYGLASGNYLVTFDTALPGSIRRSVGISGVLAGQTLQGLDVRPATNTLYALGYNASAASGAANAQLYTLNPTTGEVSAVGPAVRLELGTGGPLGFDFSPADYVRVVGTTRTNYRLNATTGALIDRSTVFYTSNTGVAPVAAIGAVAHSNSYQGATRSTLYGYDVSRNVLATIAVSLPPVDGQLTVVGSSGITASTSAPTVDLDIYSTSAGTNAAYLVANTGTTTATSLYTVNLSTGAATLVGRIGAGLVVRNIAVAAAAGVVTAARPAELATDLTLYPNPLAEATSLSFDLSRAAHAELLVIDALGRTVDMLDAGLLPAGPQTIRWQRGSQAAGCYFFRLRLDGQPAGTRTAMVQ